jgi:hypothetical protein
MVAHVSHLKIFILGCDYKPLNESNYFVNFLKFSMIYLSCFQLTNERDVNW